MTLLAKIALKLAMSGDGRKILFGVVAFALFFAFLLLIAPLAIFSRVPAADPLSFKTYKDAAASWNAETGQNVNWQYMIAIDAVLLEQDFDKLAQYHINRHRGRFLYQVETTRTAECPPESPAPAAGTDESSEADVSPAPEASPLPQMCTETVWVWQQRPLEQALAQLVAAGEMTAEEVEQVYVFLETDMEQFVDVGGGENLPPGWAPLEGELMWPVPGVTRITSLFGPRTHPLEGIRKNHDGLDIGAATGATVVAAADGYVESASFSGNAGNAVVLNHGNGLRTKYFHLSAIGAKRGTSVKKGDKIGEVGSTGASTGAHLHFETHIDGKPVNPLDYFRKM